MFSIFPSKKKLSNHSTDRVQQKLHFLERLVVVIAFRSFRDDVDLDVLIISPQSL